MTAERARQLSNAYLNEEREFVDEKIKEACGRGHYKVWIQEKYLNDKVDSLKEYYRSLGFDVKDRIGGNVKEFLISWE